MRSLKKMSIGELLSDSNEVLLREQMKAVKGAKEPCVMYCGSGQVHIGHSCDPDYVYDFCGDYGWMCSCF